MFPNVLIVIPQYCWNKERIFHTGLKHRTQIEGDMQNEGPSSLNDRIQNNPGQTRNNYKGYKLDDSGSKSGTCLWFKKDYHHYLNLVKSRIIKNLRLIL